MQTLSDALSDAFMKDSYRCVLSGPQSKQEKFRRIDLRLVNDIYQVEKYTDTQVFHEKMNHSEATAFLLANLGDTYKNLHTWSPASEYSIQVNKKGRFLLRTQAPDNARETSPPQTHNREKNYILKPGEGIAPLVDMGIFTADGKVVRSMYDKYKQINRFIEIVDDEIRKTTRKELTILDFGCGKSYLTFVLYYYFTHIRNIPVKMIGLDLKEDVIRKCNEAARKYGYENLSFEVGDIGSYRREEPVDIVITLHACDTATDYALFNAISWDAEMIFSVPCCQHELNSQIKSEKFSLLTRYGIVKERYSALLTDAIRCNLLEYLGYRTQLLEFIDFDHTPKNIMIRAVRSGGENHPDTRSSRKAQAALTEAETMIREFELDPTFYRLLRERYAFSEGENRER